MLLIARLFKDFSLVPRSPSSIHCPRFVILTFASSKDKAYEKSATVTRLVLRRISSQGGRASALLSHCDRIMLVMNNLYF